MEPTYKFVWLNSLDSSVTLPDGRIGYASTTHTFFAFLEEEAQGTRVQALHTKNTLDSISLGLSSSLEKKFRSFLAANYNKYTGRAYCKHDKK